MTKKTCPVCGAEVPAGKRKDSIYCTRAHAAVARAARRTRLARLGAEVARLTTPPPS